MCSDGCLKSDCWSLLSDYGSEENITCKSKNDPKKPEQLKLQLVWQIKTQRGTIARSSSD